ncbi:probable disease resistance protein RPP1 [Oryza glaberrima]|uniref:probable disease resistance protein RPP1 n=1 Tax=Oryza glaberrima TaxID=4538 RepID=UPI00224C417A|nr:probable disease resistance protein RPP1 [Oryza glaberrima]
MVAGNCNDRPSLQELKIKNCGITGKWLSQMLQHVQGVQNRNDGQANENDYSLETTLPCFLGKPIRLKKIVVEESPSLKFLQLKSCTALEHLKIQGCASLATLEGLQFLLALRHLEVYRCPSLLPYWESLSGQGYDLCPRLERLNIDDPFILYTSFCKHLTSLQELRFWFCTNLIDLPTALHSLPSLKRLEICSCWSIARLPEKGLPPSLEELDIDDCKEELAQQCRTLPSTLKVKIDGTYVN